MIIFGYWCDGMTPYWGHLQSSPRNSTNSINLMTRSRLTFGSCELWKWRHPMQFTTLEYLGPTWSIDDGRLHKFPKAVFVFNGEYWLWNGFPQINTVLLQMFDTQRKTYRLLELWCQCCCRKLRHSDLEPARCHILHLSDNDAGIIVGINNDFVLEVTKSMQKTIYIPFISIFESFFSWNFSYHQNKTIETKFKFLKITKNLYMSNLAVVIYSLIPQFISLAFLVNQRVSQIIIDASEVWSSIHSFRVLQPIWIRSGDRGRFFFATKRVEMVEKVDVFFHNVFFNTRVDPWKWS